MDPQPSTFNKTPATQKRKENAAYLKLTQRSFPGAHFFHSTRNREIKYFLPRKVVWNELRLQQDKKNNNFTART